MMRIESVSASADRMGRYRVVFENGAVMRLYRQTVEDFGLYSGRELETAEMDALRTAAGAMSAKMRAVRIVSATSVSRRDLEQRLICKGETPQQAKAAVEWMSDLSLLDDRKTAEQIVDRCISKGYGMARARQELYEKRIPKDLWEEALAEYPDQTERIAAFLRAKLGTDWTEKNMKRAIDAAMRRGHSYQAIRRALVMLEADLEEFPEE